MFILFAVFVIICLYGIKINLKSTEYFSDYISLDKTTSVKGIFIMLVFFSHFNQYVTYSGKLDIIYVKILAIVGQIMVVPFLFYSGYGIMESIKKKGMAYVNKIPKNRFFKVWLEYALSVVLLAIISFAISKPVTLKEFFGGIFIYGRSWYIFAILCFYLFTYVAFKLTKRQKMLRGGVLVTIFCILYIAVIQNFKPRFWYDTVLCYPLGMFYSLYREKIEKLVANKLYMWIIALLICGTASIALKVFGNNALIPVLIGFMMTGLFVVFVTMRISFGNKILDWCGKYIYEILILHRIPMTVFDQLGIIKNNPILGFVLSLISTMILSYLFSKLYKKLWSNVSGQAKLIKEN